MKIAHWTFLNGSGLANMATAIADAEKVAGSDSVVCDTNNPATWEMGDNVDIHVVHSHIPDKLSFDKSKKFVVVMHGAPEHVFEQSVVHGLNGNYGASDPLAMISYLLKRADAIVTFWPRQEAIFKTMSSAPMYCVPMGVNKEFWRPIQKQRLLSGTPAILTAENCHTCKWPLDAMIMWPWIVEAIDTARLHFINIPYDQHRWWLPLSYMNGARYTTYISPLKLPMGQLRDFICAADFYYSPVEYGDFNMMCLEAKACGAKVISYVGNPYADFWITEGDQRNQAAEFIEIISGKRTALPVLDVPDIAKTAKAMIKIYEEMK